MRVGTLGGDRGHHPGHDLRGDPVTAQQCTRCGTFAPVRLADVFSDCGWNLPYRLCGACYAHYERLDSAAAALFAQDLWQRSAVRHMEVKGHA